MSNLELHIKIIHFYCAFYASHNIRKGFEMVEPVDSNDSNMPFSVLYDVEIQ